MSVWRTRSRFLLPWLKAETSPIRTKRYPETLHRTLNPKALNPKTLNPKTLNPQTLNRITLNPKP